VNHVGIGSDYDGVERSVFLVMKHHKSSIGYVNNFVLPYTHKLNS